MEEKGFPSTTSFQVMKGIFFLFLVLSSFTASFLTIFFLLSLLTLLDWNSWDERRSEDGARLRLSVSFLLVLTLLNLMQVYVGWTGLKRKEVAYLAVYLVFEFLCFVMWFLCLMFQEQKSLPAFKMATSFPSITVTLIMILQTVRAPDLNDR